MVVRLGAIAAEQHAGTKELIVEILAYEFPLSAKQIFNTVNRKYGKQVSYHAVYKGINALLNARIIAKQGMLYSLNKEYVKGVCDFASKLNLLYGQEKFDLVKWFPKENFVLKKFNNQFEMGLFILGILDDCKKDEMIAIIWPTMWPPLTNVQEMSDKIKSIATKTSEAYCVCGKSGFLDKIFAKKWENLGMHVKLDVQLSQIFEIFAFRDMTIFFLQPPEKRFQKYKYLNLVKNLNFLRMADVFLQIIKEETEIYCFIIKNTEIADKIKQEVLNYF